MDTITSKRHITNFYCALFLYAFSFLGFAAFFIYTSIQTYKTHTVTGKVFFMLIIAVAIFGFTFYFITAYIKNVPKIIITSESISFDSIIYSLKDIDRIKFTGKSQFIIGPNLECAMIVFKDNTIRLIFDSMYSNSSSMKLLLDQIFNNRKKLQIEKDAIDTSNEHFYYYKGFLINNINGIALICIILFPFTIPLRELNYKGNIIIICIFIFSIFLFSRFFNYFGLNSDHLLIKNHLIFWKRHTHKTRYIEEIIFETQYRGPNLLKIIFKDYTSKKYTAATLTDNKWKELEKELLQLNIKVRNEL